jgi:IS30 family transposase
LSRSRGRYRSRASTADTHLEFRLEVQLWLSRRVALFAQAEKANQPSAPRTFFDNHEEETHVKYQQLTLEERYQIHALRKQHFSCADIGRKLSRHSTTISRELSRNGHSYGVVLEYTPNAAQKKARDRRIAAGKLRWKIADTLKQMVEDKIRQSWSPEQISARLSLEGRTTVSAETIYQHIMRDDAAGGMLRYALRKRRRRHGRLTKTASAERARGRLRHIEHRPAEANKRSTPGHWERDCIVGERGKSALLVAVDRNSRLTRISRVSNTTADEVARHTLRMLDGLPVKSITNDNGSEFAGATALERRIRAPIFFCDPSSPWQRGTVENTNGLVRQYVPKKMNIDELPSSFVTALEETLNHRPRKVLGYRTPYEVFFDEESSLMTNGPKLHFGLEFAVGDLKSGCFVGI